MNNRFDTVRLAAALAVFAAHGVVLYQLTVLEPFRGHGLGALAVGVFFFVSGYLVCQSWLRAPSWPVFWRKRMLRIFPRAAGRRHADRLSAPGGQPGRCTTGAPQRPGGIGQTTPSPWPRCKLCRGCSRTTLCAGRKWFTVDHPLRIGDVPATGLRSLAGPWGYVGFSGPGGSHGAAVARHHHLALGCSFPVATQDSPWDVLRLRDAGAFGVPFFIGSSFAAYRVHPGHWMGAVAVLRDDPHLAAKRLFCAKQGCGPC